MFTCVKSVKHNLCARVQPYPAGWNLPGGGAQRGNVLNLNGAGDPLTPGYPAKGAYVCVLVHRACMSVYMCVVSLSNERLSPVLQTIPTDSALRMGWGSLRFLCIQLVSMMQFTC